jgi:hypothetical protein
MNCIFHPIALADSSAVRHSTKDEIHANTRNDQ